MAYEELAFAEIVHFSNCGRARTATGWSESPILRSSARSLGRAFLYIKGCGFKPARQ